MNSLSTASPSLWPLALYFLATLVLVALMIGLSSLLGERHRESATDLPYESGVASFGSARLRFPANFYLIALFFVIFDLEAVFVLAWAIAIRDVGVWGYVAMSIFIGMLLVALAYLWKLGALESGISRHRTESLPALRAERSARPVHTNPSQ